MYLIGRTSTASLGFALYVLRQFVFLFGVRCPQQCVVVSWDTRPPPLPGVSNLRAVPIRIVLVCAVHSSVCFAALVSQDQRSPPPWSFHTGSCICCAFFYKERLTKRIQSITHPDSWRCCTQKWDCLRRNEHILGYIMEHTGLGGWLSKCNTWVSGK